MIKLLNKDSNEVIETLRLQGFRITQPRRIIIEYLMENGDHPTVEEIYSQISSRYPNISLATIYNNINFLVEIGLVYEIKSSGKVSRYDFIKQRHSHIICESCGKVADFISPGVRSIQQDAIKQSGYLIEDSQLELIGLCPECQLKRNNS